MLSVIFKLYNVSSAQRVEIILKGQQMRCGARCFHFSVLYSKALAFHLSQNSKNAHSNLQGMGSKP